MSLSKDVKSRKLPTESSNLRSVTKPVWKGPESKEDNGGITFSLLNKFMECRERFRLRVIEGLRVHDTFSHKIEFGNMWHVCEEAFAQGKESMGWKDDLMHYVEGLCRKYRLQQEEIDKWYNVCRVQFPIYVGYWSRHNDMRNRTPLLSEHVFKVPYKLPSGRTVILRGKWDSVDLVSTKKVHEIWLQENKTKGDIVPDKLVRQLTFDLQTMIYLVSLIDMREKYPSTATEHFEGAPIKGVRYNVIRRPLSGGKGTIKQKQNETKQEYYQRLATYIEEDPGHYFMRWNVEITPKEVEDFKRKCLNPLLEQLCDWWEFVSQSNDNPWIDLAGEYPGIHYQTPYGIYSSLQDGGESDIDQYINSGNMVGLERVSNLFPEL